MGLVFRGWGLIRNFSYPMLGLIRGAYGQSDDVPNVKNHDTMILCFSINECIPKLTSMGVSECI